MPVRQLSQVSKCKCHSCCGASCGYSRVLHGRRTNAMSMYGEGTVAARSVQMATWCYLAGATVINLSGDEEWNLFKV